MMLSIGGFCKVLRVWGFVLYFELSVEIEYFSIQLRRFFLKNIFGSVNCEKVINIKLKKGNKQ